MLLNFAAAVHLRYLRSIPNSESARSHSDTGGGCLKSLKLNSEYHGNKDPQQVWVLYPLLKSVPGFKKLNPRHQERNYDLVELGRTWCGRKEIEQDTKWPSLPRDEPCWVDDEGHARWWGMMMQDDVKFIKKRTAVLWRDMNWRNVGWRGMRKYDA